MKVNKLYIVAWQSTYCDSSNLTVGYLPFSEAPKVLREAVVSGKETLFLDLSGLRGIYEKKKLAEAHLRAERAWRGFRNKLWIITINPFRGRN